MIPRVLGFVFLGEALLLLVPCRLCLAEESSRMGSHCGLAAARYVLKSFGMPIDRGELAPVESNEQSSLSELRAVFERSMLRVKCYEQTATSLSGWSHLNRLVQTRNAIVLVLTATSETDVGHYFALSGFSQGDVKLLDPSTRRVFSRPIAEFTIKPSSVFVMVVYHPGANALTLPLPREWTILFYALLCLALCLTLSKRLAPKNAPRSGKVIALCAISLSFFIGCKPVSVISIEGGIQDLGTVKLGEELAANITIHNRGTQAVHIMAIELGCSCLRTEFSQRILEPQEKYRFAITITDHILGSHVQAGQVVFQDHQNVSHFRPYNLSYVVEADLELFPNPYSLGIVESEALSAGIPFKVVVHDFQGKDVDSIVIALEVVSYLGVEHPQCSVSFGDDNICRHIDLVFSAQGGLGAFEALFDVVVQVDDDVRRLPLHISGHSIEGRYNEDMSH